MQQCQSCNVHSDKCRICTQLVILKAFEKQTRGGRNLILGSVMSFLPIPVLLFTSFLWKCCRRRLLSALLCLLIFAQLLASVGRLLLAFSKSKTHRFDIFLMRCAEANPWSSLCPSAETSLKQWLVISIPFTIYLYKALISQFLWNNFSAWTVPS